MLDVAVLRNIEPAASNPFLQLSKYYTDKCGAASSEVNRPFSHIKTKPNGTFVMKLTLLPFQMMIIPLSYLTKQIIGFTNADKLRVVRQIELRYKNFSAIK